MSEQIRSRISALELPPNEWHKRKIIAQFDENLRLLRATENNDLRHTIKHDLLPQLIMNPETHGQLSPNGLKVTLEHVGLEPDEILHAWSSSYSNPDSQKKLDKLYVDNFVQIAMLEAERPGIAKTLHDEFGIKTFARYSEDFLISQYDNRDNRDVPYGIAILPREDHNGAFYHDSPSLDQLNKNLDGKYAVRAYEVDGQFGLAKALIKADQRYGPDDKDGHKISFGFIAGHGSSGSIQFGKKDHLATGDEFFENEKWQGRIKKIFDKDASIILSACLTGESGGIAHQIAHGIDTTVIGPNEVTTTLNIKMDEQQGKLLFDIAYKGSGDKAVETKSYTVNDPIEIQIIDLANEEASDDPVFDLIDVNEKAE